ncbi:MAG: hypothetical protein JOZ64_16475 [Solirubrobacterales bacterium]|nr:hypothetical protein [Solirubrobacterales bacterium]
MTGGGGIWAAERVLADLERLVLHARPRVEFFDEAAARLKRAVQFDGACWHTLDPGSGLITQHRLQDLPDRFPVLAHNEYAVEDVNKFDQLARAKRKAATMAHATGGHPERSARFRDLLTPAGLGPELRSAFVADGCAWGSLIVVRRAGEPEFTEREVELFDRASGLFARAVRRGLVAEACDSTVPLPDAPGVIELDRSGGVLGLSSSAEPLLAELSGGTVVDHLKQIFDKTGARTRGELSATLFFGEHLRRIAERMPVGDDASFVDAPRPRGIDADTP